MKAGKTLLFFLAPLLLSLILHAYLFHYDLAGYHVWRQTQTQTVVYHFTFSDNNILNPQRFDLSSGSSQLLYEFPLYQWLIAQVNHVFGYQIAHTRVMSLLFFYFMLAGSYLLFRHFFSQKVSLLANACICFSPLLYYYCVNPLPDILALGFGMWTLYFFFSYLNTKRGLFFFLFAFLSCLAVLAKLPFVMFAGGYVCLIFDWIKEKNFRKVFYSSGLFLILQIPALLWYSRAIPTWKTNKVGLGISANQKSLWDLLDYFQSNLISSIPELVTNYAACPFLFYGFYLFFKERKWRNTKVRYLVHSFFFCCLYFLYELNMIGRTHDYYLIPFIPFIFLVVGFGISRLLTSRKSAVVYLLVCLTPLLAFLRIDHRWNEKDPGFPISFRELQEEVQQKVPAGDTCIVYFDDTKYIALYYFKRRGFSLYEDELNNDKLIELSSRGAKYFITQQQDFDPQQYSGLQFEQLVGKKLKVYRIYRK